MTRFAVMAGLLLAGHADAASDVPPRRAGALLAWLAAGTYRERFMPEPAGAHPSAGPHGARVLTFYNPVLVEDLRTGRTVFRKTAAMVKELSDDAGEVQGWAAMVKVRRRSGARGMGWLFYETLNRNGRNATFGRGHRTCTGCHALGVDYLRSDFRP